MRKLEEALEEAEDFKAESEAVAAILKDLSDDDYDTPTQFKAWTIYDILTHLHLWNIAADWTLTQPDKFTALMVDVMTVFQGGKTHQDFQRDWAQKQGLDTGKKLYIAWLDGFAAVAEKYAAADPSPISASPRPAGRYGNGTSRKPTTSSKALPQNFPKSSPNAATSPTPRCK